VLEAWETQKGKAFTLGIVLIAIAVVMFVVGRPNGAAARFLNTEVVAQIYMIAIMILVVAGLALSIASNPF
jgi:hypothetical protein